LSNTAEQVASGNLNVVAQPSGTRETQTLARTFNSLLERVRSLLQRQKTETHKAQLFAEITSFSVESVSDLQPVFSHALDGIRDILAIEYAALYWICPTGRGSLAVQSMQPGWAAASNWAVAELQLSPEQFAAYQSGQITTTDRITEAGFSSDYQQQLQELGINFSLVLPVLTAEGLFGLLVAHRHTGKQDWTTSEIHTLQQLLSQLKLVIERVTALDQNREARRTAEALSEEQRRQKEQLQQQVLTLIHEVESVSQGDLTVRATLTEDEIGKVANFLNFTIASLQTLVTQVKDASTQVNTYLQQNEQSVSQLASEAKQQTHQTTRSLDSVQQIQHAIQLIAESAHQAADVAHRVSAVAQTGGLSMDHTTQKIMDLQQTIMSAAKKVARLGNSSQNISQITGLLKEVALQMTTLSNHTNSEVPLETSQDGTEASQQFAAIAEKFKYLAGRTVEATHPIEQFLETIQRETRQVVEAMEQVTAQMLEGAHLVQESKQSLSQMLEVSHQIDQLAHSISEATGSQVQTTQSVASLMQEIAQLSERTSDCSGQLAEALHQTVAVAQDLQASVKTFKVTS
jgi:methyl-accepting chemotaxis protein